MKLILVDLKSQVVDAWKKLFQGYQAVEIAQGSIFDIQCDAIVSPANSFGFMDGGIDMAISRHFGWHVQDRVQALIQSKHHGELLVGVADIVATDDPQIPYVIAAPTMRVPMLLEPTSVNVYLATRAVLLLTKYGSFADGSAISEVVQQVAVPGMGTGVGGFPPTICAKQMKQAVDDVLRESFTYPESWFEAQTRHQLLYGDDFRDLQY
jgi:O-acetyl-ADP-ribose deacetylase (regulator of RNase III)